MSDSTGPGFLSSTSSPPDDDQALDVVLQAWVVGLTGLPGSLVRPRWQLAPPPQPDQTVNWCAIGVLTQQPDANEAMVHTPAGGAGLGTSMMQRHEELEALASFYGPAAGGYAGLVRDNSRIGQNRDWLTVHGIQLVGTGTIHIVPDLVNQLWVRRADIDITFRRQINREFPLRTLLAAPTTTTNTL